jgi:hypothetical protein
MSNQITKWQNIKPFIVVGIVTDIKRCYIAPFICLIRLNINILKYKIEC